MSPHSEEDDPFPIVLVTGASIGGRIDHSRPEVRALAARRGWKKHEAQHKGRQSRSRGSASSGGPSTSRRSPRENIAQQLSSCSCHVGHPDWTSSTIRDLSDYDERVQNDSDSASPASACSIPSTILHPSDDIYTCDSIALYNTELTQFHQKIFIQGIHGFCEAFGGALPIPHGMFSKSSTLNAMSALLLQAYEDLEGRHETQALRVRSLRAPSRQVAEYYTRALQDLRKDFEVGNANEAALTTVSLMSTMAGRLGDFEQQDMHRRALTQMVKQRGGLFHLTSAARAFILRFEFASMLQTGKTVFEELDHGRPRRRYLGKPGTPSTSHNKYTTRREISELTREGLRGQQQDFGKVSLPCGFQKLVNLRLMSPVLIRVVSEITRNRRRPQTSSQALSGCADTSFDLFDGCPEMASIKLQADERLKINTLAFLGVLLYASIGLNGFEIWQSMTIWPGIDETREALTGKLIAMLPDFSAIRLMQQSGVSVQDIVEHDCIAIEDLVQWLILLALASWKTCNGTLHSRGLELVVVATQCQRLTVMTGKLAADLAAIKRLLEKFIWNDDFDLALVTTAIRASAISTNYHSKYSEPQGLE